MFPGYSFEVSRMLETQREAMVRQCKEHKKSWGLFKGLRSLFCFFW